MLALFCCTQVDKGTAGGTHELADGIQIRIHKMKEDVQVIQYDIDGLAA